MSNGGEMRERIWLDAGVDDEPSSDGFLDVFVSVEPAQGDVEFIRSDIHQREIERLERKIDGLKAMSVRIYNNGYLGGHHDTVEGCYTDVHISDIDNYHEDIVDELIEHFSEVEV